MKLNWLKKSKRYGRIEIDSDSYTSEYVLIFIFSYTNSAKLRKQSKNTRDFSHEMN